MKYSKLPAERYGKGIFGNQYNRALWCPSIISKMVTNKIIMHFTEYRCWSPHYLLLTCRQLIFRPSISQDKSNQNIFIFWFDFQNSCSNCKFLAGGTWQWRGGGRGLLQMMHGKCRRSWNRVTDNILGSFLGLSSLECAHFCCCFPPSLVRQQSVSGCRVFVQVETRYI